MAAPASVSTPVLLSGRKLSVLTDTLKMKYFLCHAPVAPLGSLVWRSPS